MIIVFFRKDIEGVQKIINNNKNNSCGLWYAPGLASYKYLHEIINISSLFIEESILDEFKKDNQYLVENYKCKTYSSDGPVFKKRVETQKNICFFASNDTIVKSFNPIIKNLEKSNFQYFLYCRKTENALEAGKSLDLKISTIDVDIPHIEKNSLLVLGNDWGLFEQKINIDFQRHRINTVCIQESSIDFNPIDRRMMYCSFPIYQGISTLKNINILNKICAVIGNPRFEELKPISLPNKNKALVNVNFTYNIYEDIRDNWVKDVVNSCQLLELDYVLSQHPRDKGDFPQYNVQKSNALLVHDAIKNSSVVISRFSALLTEAICLDRPVIYYNPHGENMHYSFEPYNKMFNYATNVMELQASLKSILLEKKEDEEVVKKFVEKHIGNAAEGKASEYISLFLSDISSFPPLKRVGLLYLIKMKLKILKRKLIKLV